MNINEPRWPMTVCIRQLGATQFGADHRRGQTCRRSLGLVTPIISEYPGTTASECCILSLQTRENFEDIMLYSASRRVYRFLGGCLGGVCDGSLV